MTFPSFFKEAPTITVYDPLAEFLGAAQEGRIEYGYEDAVRLAGHSCPTVAGSYLMCRAALRALYPDSTPVRGDILVEMANPEDEGVTGVMAQVFTLLTGATLNNGFHGIGGHFSRVHMLKYAQAPGSAFVARFARADTGASVHVRLNMGALRPTPSFSHLIGPALTGRATGEQVQEFREAWQARVRMVLIDYADDTNFIQVVKAA